MRVRGSGVGSIPLSEISDYFAVFFAPHDIRTFCRIIRLIDGHVLSKINKEANRK